MEQFSSSFKDLTETCVFEGCQDNVIQDFIITNITDNDLERGQFNQLPLTASNQHSVNTI